MKKEYLTLDEVKQLAATPCDIPVLKAASLFACLTGLRISDIQNLQWEDFTIAPDQGYCLRIRTQKTQTEATLPISNEAYELCGTPGTGKVFKGLKRSMINYPLKNWIKKAGITKPITFHGFRHSYAVIQISLGTDIYTVSKMLTHKNVTTTQIYADLVNSKKRETANKNASGKYVLQNADIIKKSLMYMPNVVPIMTPNLKRPNCFSKWYRI